MERDSFLFYRSFYEAIRRMPSDVQAEIYPAIMEYALFGKQPKNLTEISQGIFLLIKPNIDVNTARFENGKKGGRKSRTKKTSPDNSDYSVTFEQEIERMLSDADWSASICDDYKISLGEYHDRLKRFLKVCKDTRKGKLHDSFDDAKSHLRYWMDKVYKPYTQSEPENVNNQLPPTDYTFNGGFGGMDT